MVKNDAFSVHVDHFFVHWLVVIVLVIGIRGSNESSAATVSVWSLSNVSLDPDTYGGAHFYLHSIIIVCYPLFMTQRRLDFIASMQGSADENTIVWYLNVELFPSQLLSNG